jgi:hypothetical protein
MSGASKGIKVSQEAQASGVPSEAEMAAYFMAADASST